jgi:hypothetical protein
LKWKEKTLNNTSFQEFLAERGRFELPAPCGAAVFETATFDLSDTSPDINLYKIKDKIA